MTKPWYKKFKVLCAIATLAIETIILITAQIMGAPLSPNMLMLMKYIFAFGIAVITGHTITDALSSINK
jgi:hypothetical protein